MRRAPPESSKRLLITMSEGDSTALIVTPLGLAAHQISARSRSAGVHELPAEAALDAEVAASDVVVHRGRGFDDSVVLDVQLQVAAYAAVGADGLGNGLAALVPGAGL